MKSINDVWGKLQAIGVTEIEEKDAFEYYPLSKEIFVIGGSDEDVANVLYECIPVLGILFLVGNRKINVNGVDVYFSRK